MSTTACDWLVDYLDHDLTAETERLFLAHLPACPACSAAVTQQRRLEEVLSRASERFDRVPVDLVAKARKRIRLASRRRTLTLAAVVSAAAAAIWWVTSVLRPIPQPLVPGSESPIQIASETTGPPEIRVTFADDARLLVVPEKTDSPDVTFLWVYRNQRETH